MSACTYEIDHWMPTKLVGRLTAKLVNRLTAKLVNCLTAKPMDCLTAKFMDLLTAKLVNRLTAKLVDRLTAKPMVVNFNQIKNIFQDRSDLQNSSSRADKTTVSAL